MRDMLYLYRGRVRGEIDFCQCPCIDLSKEMPLMLLWYSCACVCVYAQEVMKNVFPPDSPGNRAQIALKGWFSVATAEVYSMAYFEPNILVLDLSSSVVLCWIKSPVSFAGCQTLLDFNWMSDSWTSLASPYLGSIGIRVCQIDGVYTTGRLSKYLV